jgi:HlyD family secretion protein
VEFTVDAFPRRIFHGDVVQVRNAPTTVQNVVTYDTVIGVNNADLKLKPGMTANLSIVGAQRDNVLKISNAALRFRPPAATPPPPPTFGTGGRPPMRKPGDLQTERTVYVLRSSKPTAVQIKTGISDGITTEVLDGLKEGDRVITAMVGKAAAQSTNNPLAGGQRRF